MTTRPSRTLVEKLPFLDIIFASVVVAVLQKKDGGSGSGTVRTGGRYFGFGVSNPLSIIHPIFIYSFRSNYTTSMSIIESFIASHNLKTKI
jgi:hypothetical protein